MKLLFDSLTHLFYWYYLFITRPAQARGIIIFIHSHKMYFYCIANNNKNKTKGRYLKFSREDSVLLMRNQKARARRKIQAKRKMEIKKFDILFLSISIGNSRS